MQTHTAEQLRSYSVKPEVEKIYDAILSAARHGDIKCMIMVPKEKVVFILLEIVKLFPDTKFTEFNTIFRNRTMIHASWPLIHTYRSQH